VLKGPQGTLFGRNATAGAVLITTTDPKSDFAFNGKLEYSSFNTFRSTGYVTGGITKNLAVDLAVSYKRTDGWFTNLTNGNDKVAKGHDFNIRAGIKLDLDDSGKNSVLFRYSHMYKLDPTAVTWSVYEDPGNKFQTYSYAAGIPGAIWGTNNRTTAADPGFEPSFWAKYDAYQLTTKFDLGFADMTNYDQIRNERSHHDIEVDDSNIPIFHVAFFNIDKLKTHETLLNSKPGGKLSWVAGVYYLDQTAGEPPFTIVTPALGDMYITKINIKSFSGFADATYQAGEKLYLTVGGRYSHDSQTGSWNCFPNGVLFGVCPPSTTFKLKFNNFSPRGVIRYEIDPNTSVYASVTRGFKAGLANANGFSTVPIEPETITAYELGFKTARGRDRAEVSGFYYDYKNLQVSTYNGTQSITTNAAASEVYGIEASFTKELITDLTLSGGIAYTHGRYKNYPGAPANIFDYVFDGLNTAGVPNGGATDGQADNRAIDASGNHMIRSPDWSGNVAVNYETDLAGGRLAFNGNLYFSSKVYFDAANNNVQPSYTLGNLRLSWSPASEHFTISAFVNNVTNKAVISQVLPNGFGTGVSWMPPRVWGGSVNVRF
jgi:iron complex outermembrane receptor protein